MTMLHVADWDDVYPSPGTLKDDLKAYIDILNKDETNLFLRPGTDHDIFKYLLSEGSKATDISDPAGTPIGELDAGYGWKIVLYADGHVKTVPE